MVAEARDVAAYQPRLVERDVGAILREGRLRFRCVEDPLDVGKQLVGVLGVGEKPATVRFVEITCFWHAVNPPSFIPAQRRNSLTL
jgi:hypothetical protein